MSWSNLLKDLGQKLNMKASQFGENYFGSVDSFSTQIVHLLDDRNQKCIQVIIHFQDSSGESSSIKEQLLESLKDKKGFKKKNLDLHDGVFSYTYVKGIMDKRSAEELHSDVLDFVSKLRAAGATPDLACVDCSQKLTEPVMINGVVGRVCDSCLKSVQEKVDFERMEYDKREINYPNVVLAGAVAAVIGTCLWAGVVVASGKMYSLIAIANGLMVGSAMMLIAKKQSKAINVLAGVLTVVSVLAGNVLSLAYLVNIDLAAQGEALDYVAFFINSPFILMADAGGTAFAGFAGLFGAAIGVSKMQGQALAPEMVVEKSGSV